MFFDLTFDASTKRLLWLPTRPMCLSKKVYYYRPARLQLHQLE